MTEENRTADSRTTAPGSESGQAVPDDSELQRLLAGTRALLGMVRDAGVRRLAVSVGGVGWELECAGAAAAAPTGGASTGGASTGEAVAGPSAAGHTVVAPLVGAFYRSPAPGKPPFVEVGTRVEAGQQVGIVEAMKMMNEVVAERAGVVRAVHVGDGAIVEYGQPLITVETEAEEIE